MDTKIRYNYQDKEFEFTSDNQSWENILNLKTVVDNTKAREFCLQMATSFKQSLLKNVSNKTELTFFAGSFNPWHEGHQACLNLCPDKMVIVVPDSNPWKNQAVKVEQSLWAYYQDLSSKINSFVYTEFIGFKKPNPTINWLPEFSSHKKNLLMGDDSFLSLDRWKEAEKLILHLNKVYVAPRLVAKDILLKQKVKIENLNSKIEIIFLEHHEFEDVSSTKKRSQKGSL